MKGKKPMRMQGLRKRKACARDVTQLQAPKIVEPTTSSPLLTRKRAGKTGKSTLKECSQEPRAIKSCATAVMIKKQKKKTSEGRILNAKSVRTHDAEACKGEACCVHNPSDHSMRGWDGYYRSDKSFLLERICPKHGVGHPDPDSMAYFKKIGADWIGVHGCCGCCRE